MPDFLAEAQALFQYTQTLRRDFHRHPELGFQEFRTAGIVARELNQLGLEVSTGIAETGVVALVEGAQPGPVVLLRFDMDALPIEEETGAAYASQNPGVMHACGHDGHTAIGLTVARLLNAHRGELAGTVKFVFQPAEEGQGGAERMVKEGVLENPRPDLSLALHLWNEKPVGWFGVGTGPVMAAAEMFKVVITGRGAHAAQPHNAQDPILAAAQVITAAQSIVARNLSPFETGILSITTVHGGDAANVIPPAVELQGTIRTFDRETRARVLARFQQVVHGVAEALGCQAEIAWHHICPAVVNHPDIASRVQKIAGQLFSGEFDGASKVVDHDFRTVVSEDMSYMMQEIPGCFFFVGSANPAAGLDAPHHHPKFDIDEQALPRAAGLMAAAAAAFLKI